MNETNLFLLQEFINTSALYVISTLFNAINLRLGNYYQSGMWAGLLAVVRVRRRVS